VTSERRRALHYAGIYAGLVPFVLIALSPVDQKVLTVGLPTMLIRGDIFFCGALMAAALLVDIPTPVAFYLVLDRYVASLTGGVDR
jgi:multiple sugar transport system permease protein